MNTIFMMAPAGADGGGMQMILMLVLMFGVFYFFMIRPQMKKQKELKKFRETISVGTSVVTIGGIHGIIHSIQDTTVVLKVEDKSIIKVEKSALITDFAAHQQQSGRR
jgi:preprotein translocase subunit YajC